ncbi:MAG: hypothetical protein ACQESP_12820 [Candidatus Muiribacteriota bacterium]
MKLSLSDAEFMIMSHTEDKLKKFKSTIEALGLNPDFAFLDNHNGVIYQEPDWDNSTYIEFKMNSFYLFINHELEWIYHHLISAINTVIVNLDNDFSKQ